MAQEILIPFFFAVLLASLLLPFNQFLERKGVRRIFSILISLTLSLAIIILIVYFLANQITNFLDDLPTIQERLETLFSTVQKWIRSTFGVTIRKQNQYINESALRMKESGAGILQQTFGTITDLLSYMVLLPVYSFLILFYRDLIKRFIVGVFKNGDEKDVKQILSQSQTVTQSFIVGLMIEMAVVFGLNATGFLILGIKYALFLALISAILNLVPYVGMLVANLFCMLITLISSEVMLMSEVIWVGIILGFVQFIDNNFLMTLIVGSKVRINALVTLLGVLVGGWLFGIPGMFLSIPGMAVIKVIFDHVDDLKPYGMMLGDVPKEKKS